MTTALTAANMDALRETVGVNVAKKTVLAIRKEDIRPIAILPLLAALLTIRDVQVMISALTDNNFNEIIRKQLDL